MTKVVVMSALLVVLACGSAVDNSGIPGGGSSGSGCTLTVSGATAGSYGCTVRLAAWSGATDTGTVMMGYGTTGQTIPVIAVSFSFPGPPRVGTFTEADPDARIDARIAVTSGSASWTATDSTSIPTVGAYRLVVSSVTSTKVLDDREIYAVSGTLDATLPPVPQSTATEDVTLHASF